MRRILVIVKFREDSAGRCAYDGTPNCYGGLYNSAAFIVEMLHQLGIAAKLAQVCDNNDIDREVSSYRPDTVIIEALWVVPEKFAVLRRLHPRVEWLVRIHSQIPFIAYEGISMKWIAEYLGEKNVYVAGNAREVVSDLRETLLTPRRSIYYLPNWYPEVAPVTGKHPDQYLDVGCFGAIRPLKNQLIQAFAAIVWAREKGKILRFHVNGRVEQGGEAVLKNLRALLPETGNQLIEHPWVPRPDFLRRIARMDVGMQVSFSETFDITAADTVAMNVPLVASHQVSWCAPASKADPTNLHSMVSRLHEATGLMRDQLVKSNLKRLRETSEEAEDVWRRFAA